MAQLFESTDWDALLSLDLDHSWSSFKSHFLSIMNTCIPTKLLPLHPLPPWISRSISSKIRKHHRLYQRAKSSSSPTVMASYRSLRNSIRSQLKKDKSTFFSSLSSAPPSKFWLFVKSLRKNPSNIPPLSSNGSVINSDADKATCLNHFFTSCQNATMPPLSPIPPLDATSGCPDEFLCTEEEIAVLIRSLASNTAPGPDLITTKMLKAATPFITYPLCYIFNLSLSLGLVPLDWKTSSVIPIPKTSPPSNPPTLLCLSTSSPTQLDPLLPPQQISTCCCQWPNVSSPPYLIWCSSRFHSWITPFHPIHKRSHQPTSLTLNSTYPIRR